MSVAQPACDRAQAHTPGTEETRHPRLVLATTILASSLAFVDGSVVNVGLPAIGRSLHAGAADLQWVINAYLLPLSALLLFGGAAGDRFGRRRLLILGTGLFALASAAAALAPSLPLLLAARALQGLASALLLPNSLAILGGAFSGEARGRAIGVWAAVGAMAAAVGPVLGGWLIDQVGWRAIFLLNLPLAAGAVALALAFVRDGPREARTALDPPGAVLATLALGAVTFGLTIGSGPGGWSAPAVAAVAAGVLLFAGFVWVERRRGDQAMMPLALFGSADFVGLTLLTVLLYGAFGGVLVLLPYMLMETGGYSATQAGAALLPLALILAAASPLTGALAGRIGPRPSLLVGPLIVGGGFLLATRIGLEGRYWSEVLPAVAVMACGMAAAAAPLTTAVLGAVDARHTGSASGFNSAAARAGGLAATALLGQALASHGEDLLHHFRAACVIAAFACLAASLSLLLLHSRKHRPKP